MRRPIQRRIQDRILAVRCIARVSGLTTSLGKKQSATAAHRAYADRLRPHARAARANKQLCRAESFNDPQAADTSNGIRACLLRAQMLLVFGPIRMIRKHRAPPNSPVVLARGRAQPGASRLVNPLTRRRHARCSSLLQDIPSVAAAGAPRRSRGTWPARSTLERRWGDAAPARIGFQRTESRDCVQADTNQLRRQRRATMCLSAALASMSCFGK